MDLLAFFWSAIASVDWLTVGATVAIVSTAFFTGVSAYVALRQHRGRLTVEWSFAYSSHGGMAAQIELDLTIRNSLPYSITPWKIEFSGIPLKDVRSGNPPAEKGQAWPASSAPLVRKAVPPGGVSTHRVVVWPDWSAISKRSRPSWGKGRRNMTGVVTVHSNENIRQLISRKQTMVVAKEMIDKQAAAQTPIQNQS